jgi:hypothetical protein
MRREGEENPTAILSNNPSILCIASTLLAAIFRVKYFAWKRKGTSLQGRDNQQT